MEECKPILNTGLRGVVIADTRICEVDGANGRLIYRGYLVQDLAEKATFEEVSFLLLYEKLPNKQELGAFKQQLAAERALPPEVIAAMKTRPKEALPMDVLQAVVPMLANHDPDIRDQSQAAVLRMATRLIAKFGSVIAAWHRIRNDQEPVEPSPDLDHAANFLYMLSGEIPDEEVARYLDKALVLHAEHSFNASTFAAREVASTRAHIYAAIAAAVGSLSGDLHGGANTRVMEMLYKIGSPENVKDYVNQEFDAGRVIFGLGHAVYDTDDPRADIVAEMSKAMENKTGKTRWYETSALLEKTGKAEFKRRKGSDIYVNVDFYSGSLYLSLGIPVDLFTPVFAVARISGWCAHVIEEQFAGAAPKPMLYRPESEYVGDYCGPDVCEFTPMDDR
ncbi:MAG: citrate (Si)-synthase [Deltaproteobacteria bacterium]|jgi:citrate synthase|nr:citrate (Si)-synthase [Deltaproteobacteria bacterium]MBW2480577.1 citrate (Si)-synthase [Deltaproteobacteria bacterium]